MRAWAWAQIQIELRQTASGRIGKFMQKAMFICRFVVINVVFAQIRDCDVCAAKCGEAGVYGAKGGEKRRLQKILTMLEVHS